MSDHEGFTIDEATSTGAGRIRGVILDTIASRVGQVADVHPRLLEGIEVAARTLGSTESTQDALRNLGERVAKHRAQRGLSYREAARDAGVAVSTLSDIEDGLIDVRVSTAIRLLDWITPLSACKRFPTGWLCDADCVNPAHDEFLPTTPDPTQGATR